MKDAQTVLDNIRQRVPGNAKLLVAWVLHDERGELGVMRCAQANLTIGEVEQIADSLKANAVRANMR